MTSVARPLVRDDDLVAAYASWDGRVAARVNHAREARRFLRDFGSLARWAALPLDQRLDAPAWARTFVAWAALSGRLAVDADYVVGCNSMWATLATRLHLVGELPTAPLLLPIVVWHRAILSREVSCSRGEVHIKEEEGW